MKASEVIESIGDIVIASAAEYGSYIGEIVGIRSTVGYQASIKVLACVEYPFQNALIYKEIIYERKPFEFGSVQHFPIEGVESYYGSVPDYDEALREALGTAIQNSTGVFQFTLLKHQRQLEEQQVAV